MQKGTPPYSPSGGEAVRPGTTSGKKTVGPRHTSVWSSARQDIGSAYCLGLWPRGKPIPFCATRCVSLPPIHPGPCTALRGGTKAAFGEPWTLWGLNPWFRNCSWSSTRPFGHGFRSTHLALPWKKAWRRQVPSPPATAARIHHSFSRAATLPLRSKLVIEVLPTTCNRR